MAEMHSAGPSARDSVKVTRNCHGTKIDGEAGVGLADGKIETGVSA